MTNRRLIALAATVVMICLGPVYSWSLFTQPLIAGFGWSTSTTTWAFSLAVLFLGFGSILGGRWQDAAGPRPVTVTGVIIWGVGNVLAGLGTARFGTWWLYLTYGVIGGLGLGLAYVTPVAAVTKWFPDKRGLGSGMVVMGFGLGAFFYNNILKMFPSFAAVSRHAQEAVAARAANPGARMPAEDVHVIMRVLIVSGVIYAVVGGLCAMLVTNPPAGSTGAPAGAPGSTAAAPARVDFTGVDFTVGRAMRTPQFYALWLMLFLNVTAGTFFISNAVSIMRELAGVSLATAVSVYGFIALFNGLGRFFWGAVSDRLGRNLAYVLIFATQVAIFFTVGRVHSLGLVATLFGVVLLDYGGGFGTMPSFTADYFGTRYMGLIYGWVLLAWGVGGVVGPIFGAWVKDHSGTFAGGLPVIAIVLIAATILPIITRRPRAAEAPGDAV